MLDLELVTEVRPQIYMFATKDANGTSIPVESKAKKFESINGVIKVPSGSGMGLVVDPDYIKTHSLFTG